MSDNVQIESGDEVKEVAVEQLLGFDLNGVEEVRGFPTAPEGIYEWRITGWSNKNVEWKTKGGDDRTSMVLECALQAISCRQCKDAEIDVATLVGTELTEGFFISKAEDLGRIKAFFIDIGMKGEGTIQDLCDQSQGMEFVAPITHRKDKNDTANVYAGLDRNCVEALGGDAPQPAVAAGAGGGGLSL